MVADFKEGRILSELNDLEEEITALDNAIATYEVTLINLGMAKEKHTKSLKRLSKRLQDAKYHQEMRLKIHRQKVKESGVKY